MIIFVEPVNTVCTNIYKEDRRRQAFKNFHQDLLSELGFTTKQSQSIELLSN